jgi:prophage maintenance system killer protein
MALYSEDEILEKVKGLLEIMYEHPTKDTVQYQSYILKIVLYELFMDANKRHQIEINNMFEMYNDYRS